MTLVPGWMWQTMHWLVGMAVVKRCCNRMARLVLGNGRVGIDGLAAVAELGIRAGMDGGAVVGINDMAGGAAAGAIVAGVVVGAEEIERRVEQPRSLQADKDRVGAVLACRGRGARAGRVAGPIPRVSRDADFRIEAAAALEDAQDVAGLGDLEAGQRIEERNDALLGDLIRSSAAARFASAAACRSCCSFRRSGPA